MTIFRYLRNWRNVVAVDRAHVAEAELLEQHAAVQAGLDRLLDLRQEPLDRIAQQRHLVEHLEHFALQPGVERVHPQPVEILGQAADARADRHLVVVEDRPAASCFRPPALFSASKTMPEGNAPSPITATEWRSSWPGMQIVAALQSQGRRDAAAGMAGHEQVVVAFVRIGVAHQAPLGADRAELVDSGR